MGALLEDEEDEYEEYNREIHKISYLDHHKCLYSISIFMDGIKRAKDKGGGYGC